MFLAVRSGRLPKFADWAEARRSDASMLTEWQVYRMFEARRGAWSTFQFLVREQLLARREAPRHESRTALGGVPGTEVADHRLRVHRRLRIGRELPHRGRAAEALRARSQLREDLLVAVALADAGTERVQPLRVDTGDLRVPAALHHFVPSSARPERSGRGATAGEYTRWDPRRSD